MVLDSSVVIAVMLEEPEADEFLSKMASAQTRLISAGSYLEASLVLMTRLAGEVERELDALLLEGGVEIVPVTAAQVQIARQAYWLFGKGRHAAGLNLGDCLSYALSKSTGQPLLFKGEHFARTDLEAA